MASTNRASSSYAATDGAAYERFIGRWSRRVADPLIAFAGSLPDGALLDVGCGTGSVARALRAAGARGTIVGLDISQPYLDFAAGQPDAAGISFVRGDACALQFEDGMFDAAFALLALNFVGEPGAAASEMRRVTRPGGVVAAAGWDFRGGLVYQRLLWDTAAVLEPEAARTRDRLFSAPLSLPDGMTELLREAGLQEIKRTSLTVRMDFASFADYWDPLLGGQGPVAGFVAALPEAKRSRIRDAVRDAFLSGAPNGPRSLTATAWAVRGVVPCA